MFERIHTEFLSFCYDVVVPLLVVLKNKTSEERILCGTPRGINSYAVLQKT